MKIGQILFSYLPNIGGGENYVYRLSYFLEKKKNDITIYTTDFSLKNGGKEEKNAFYCKTTFTLLRNPFSYELLKKLRESEDDIYHIHSPWFLTSLSATRVLKNRPKVMTVHSAEITNKNFKIRILNKLYHPLAQYSLRNMDKLIVLSKREKEILLRSFSISRKKVIVIPNGIYLDDFKPSKINNEKFIEKYKLQEDSFKILFVSRLVREKNPHKLVNSMKYLKDNNVEVILIGGRNGRYVDELKRNNDARVHVLGKVDFDELVAAYHTSDLFVFLGTWEGLPTVILEAMACGLPILTTPVGGILDIITENKNGFFIQHPIDEMNLANKINYIMNNADINEISKANMEKVKTQYNWDVIANKILDVYNQVLEEYK
ncbi:D-inositol-3-phosphate glycosyltransferase [ANME-1 cluster archaeon GoMg1]|nr:D-inositol-3-phosphate glycosyltransferase [ANME-1 cluster archaeon GoMg1]